MENQIQTVKTTNKVGYYAATLTTVVTIITFVIAYLTPPLSGPLCQGSCFAYPYTGVASRFPRDYIWMYPAMLLMVIYVVLMACIYRYASEDKKIYSLVGLFFAFSAALVFIGDYFVQLSVIQPSLLKGETDGVSILTQFNSHGVFIVLEELGYLFMGMAFLFMAPVFFGSRLEKAIRWTFIASFALTVISLVVFSVLYGINREYRFEVAAISIAWLTLIVSDILLSVLFKRSSKILSQE